MVQAETGLIIREQDKNNLTCNVCGEELTFGEGEDHGTYRVLCCNRSYIILPETYRVTALALNEFNIGQEILANTLETEDDEEDEDEDEVNDIIEETELENEQEQSQEEKEEKEEI